MEAGAGRGGNAAHHALMEVAELLSAKSRGTATDSSDLDVSADFDVGVDRHIHTSRILKILFG
jgi:hypothetical protein